MRTSNVQQTVAIAVPNSELSANCESIEQFIAASREQVKGVMAFPLYLNWQVTGSDGVRFDAHGVTSDELYDGPAPTDTAPACGIRYGSLENTKRRLASEKSRLMKELKAATSEVKLLRLNGSGFALDVLNARCQSLTAQIDWLSMVLFYLDAESAAQTYEDAL
jgi:hypothetical protein